MGVRIIVTIESWQVADYGDPVYDEYAKVVICKGMSGCDCDMYIRDDWYYHGSW